MPMFILAKGDFTRRFLRGCRPVLTMLLCMAVWGANNPAESGQRDFFSTVLSDVQWKLEGQPYRYTPPDLYEYINGAAEFFIGFGFVELTGANYTPVAGGDDYASIDIYDLGSKLNAFGVFQSKRDRQASVENLGAAATVSDDYAAFFKGKYYVEIQAVIADKHARSIIAVMASAVAKRLPGDDTLPPELAYFPKQGRIVGSERYLRDGVLGHAFLKQGIVCGYHIEGTPATAFIVMLDSDQAAVNAIQRHRFFLEEGGQKPLPLDGLGAYAFASEEPYHQKIVATHSGPFVIGVYDLKRVEAGKTLLKAILDAIAERDQRK